MSSYITVAQAKTLLGRTLDVYNDSDGAFQSSHLELVIDECEGMINSAIGSRYTIPPTSTNALNFLRGLVVPLLRFKTYNQFTDMSDVPEGVITEYKAAMDTLSKLARQVISLPDQADKSTGRASHIKISTDTTTTGF